MKGTITALPDGHNRGYVQPETPRSGLRILDAQAIAGAPADLRLAVGTKIAFDSEGRAGFMFAVNLRDPTSEPALAVPPAQQNAATPATPTPNPTADPEPVATAPLPTPLAQGGQPVRPSAALDNRPAPARPHESQTATIAPRQCNQHQPPATLPGTRETTPAPYTFVPVHTQGGSVTAHLAAPILHDGQPETDRFSGELRIEIKALTPLLAGQHRYEWRRLRKADGEPLLADHFRPAKKILEPAVIDLKSGQPATVPPGTVASDTAWATRRVLIPGTSIKGPIRQAIAAMLNAPMERVGERYLSYRPNVDTSNVTNPRYKPFAAVVQTVHANGSAVVKLLKKLTDVLFVESPDALFGSTEQPF